VFSYKYNLYYIKLYVEFHRTLVFLKYIEYVETCDECRAVSIIDSLHERSDRWRIGQHGSRNDNSNTSIYVYIYRACAFVIRGFLSFGLCEEAHLVPLLLSMLKKRFNRSSSYQTLAGYCLQISNEESRLGNFACCSCKCGTNM